MGAALYAEGTEGGGEDGDEEIDDGFPIRLFHVHSFCLMFDNILITLKMGRMSKYPFMTGILYCLLMVALGVIGILRTAPCLVFRCYQMVTSSLSPVPESVPESVPVLPPLGVVPPPLGVVSPPLGGVPPGVLSSPGLWVLLLFTASTRLIDVSRLADDNSPVALARSFKPMMYFATLKSALVSAPPFTFRPMEKMARSGNLTFLPRRSSSLVQTTASVRMPLMAPLLNGVLWLAMCSANSSSPMVSSATTRGYHFW